MKVCNPNRYHGNKAYYINDNEKIPIDYENIQFPVSYNDNTIKEIDSKNSIRINLFRYKDTHELIPIYHSQYNEYENLMNLVYYIYKNIIICTLKIKTVMKGMINKHANKNINAIYV